ncbi:MAG: 50S ribosomal protein L17 [candidate division WOR-3 bacterium]|nr:50S ribosomal protein L17 [candidate division WOR-3 bacterium]MCX7837294.1 50S ribosomal protein L17 [candidate division WOR-3 bacterium]MDW8113943.1 50S ribosomal protein L17 [candidate division WOR-3 bacterium]
MRHKKKVKKLQRDVDHRRALIRNLCCSLLKYGKIETTLVKAKAMRPFMEHLIDIAKKDTVANRRRAFAFLCDRKLVKKLFEDVAKRFSNINGGYTRIIRTTTRTGDNAQMAIIEFTKAAQ